MDRDTKNIVTEEEASIRDTFAISIRHKTPHVSHQKEEGFCQKVVLSDVMSTVFRETYDGLHLSPQTLVDADPRDIRALLEFSTNKSLGVESITAYQFVRYKRFIERWSDANYQVSGARYTLDRTVYVDRFQLEEYKGGDVTDRRSLKEALLGMFGEGGYHFPCLAVLCLGELFNKDVAASYTSENPYLHPVKTKNIQESRRRYGHDHAVLIVGIDTRSDDPSKHCCEIKSTYGVNWGKDGFTWVGIDVFEYVVFPVLKKE